MSKRLSKKVLLEKIKSAFRDIPQIEFAYIYGSFLDRPHFEDIDLAVQLKTGRAAKSREKIASKLEKRLSQIKPEFLLTESARESGFWDIHFLEEMPLPLQFRVIEKGGILVERNPTKRKNWENRVLRNYLDFEPAYHATMDKAIQKMSRKLWKEEV